MAFAVVGSVIPVAPCLGERGVAQQAETAHGLAFGKHPQVAGAVRHVYAPGCAALVYGRLHLQFVGLGKPARRHVEGECRFVGHYDKALSPHETEHHAAHRPQGRRHPVGACHSAVGVEARHHPLGDHERVAFVTAFCQYRHAFQGSEPPAPARCHGVGRESRLLKVVCGACRVCRGHAQVVAIYGYAADVPVGGFARHGAQTREIHSRVAVETAQPVRRAQPYIAVGVLGYAVDVVARQPVGGRYAAACQLQVGAHGHVCRCCQCKGEQCSSHGVCRHGRLLSFVCFTLQMYKKRCKSMSASS